MSFVPRALALSALALCACATTTTTPVAAVSGRPTYQIECMRVGECWTAARRACGGGYRTLQRYDNWISESDLPGLNERTDRHSYQRWDIDPHLRSPRPYGPGGESDQPLPITDVVVMCTDG